MTADRPRVLVAVRLFSGLCASVDTGVWRPTGAPAVSKLLQALATDGAPAELLLLDGDARGARRDRPVAFDGLALPAQVIAGPGALTWVPERLRPWLAELRQAWRVMAAARRFRPDVVYVDRGGLWTAGLLARLTRWPVVLRMLGISPALREANAGDRPLHRVMRWLLRAPFALVICSRDGSGGELWLDRLLRTGVPRAVLLNGVDDPGPGDGPEVALPADRTIVTFLGRLDALKDLRLFVEAIERAERESPGAIHALIVGDGDEGAWLEERLADPHLARVVTWLRAVPHAAVAGLLARSDVYVSLNTMGNLSNANLEALRAGCAMIVPASDAAIGRDLDTDRLLPADVVARVPAGDAAALAETLLRLHADGDERRRRGDGAAARASSLLTTWHERIALERELLAAVAAGAPLPPDVVGSGGVDVALVIADLGAGGAQRVATRLAAAWTQAGRTVALVTWSDPKADFYRVDPRVRRIALGTLPPSGSLLAGVAANLRRVRRLRRALRDLKPRVAVGFIAPTNVLLVLAARGLDVRVVVSERNDPARQSFGRLWDTLRRHLYRRADRVVANSHGALETLAGYVPRARLAYAANPLPEAVEGGQAALAAPSVLAVGRLHRQKAYDVLLRAFARFAAEHPAWRLVVLGDGDERAALEAQARDLGIDEKVDWRGVVADPGPFYAAAEIYALPSRYEGMPNALLEAMAAALPPVVSDTAGAATELVRDGESGLVVPVDDDAALAAALARLAGDAALRQTLGEAARARTRDTATALSDWAAALALDEAPAA